MFVFHGKGGSGSAVRGAFGLEAEAKGKAVFVYPDGLNKDWNYNDPVARNDDVQLFDAVLDKLKNDVCIDTGRVFATGFSNGGYFANHLGCYRGGVIRAVASHGGGGPVGGDRARAPGAGARLAGAGGRAVRAARGLGDRGLPAVASYSRRTPIPKLSMSSSSLVPTTRTVSRV